jgi:cytochrome c553
LFNQLFADLRDKNMMLKFCLFALTLGLLQGTASATESVVAGQRLAATCANCHGTNGISAGGAIPGLAGNSKQSTIAGMKAFQAGTRPATVMHQIAKGYSDEQIELIANFFAQQKK